MAGINAARMKEVMTKLQDPAVQRRLQEIIMNTSNLAIEGKSTGSKVVVSYRRMQVEQVSLQDPWRASAPRAEVEDAIRTAVNAAVANHQTAVSEAIEVEVPGYKEVVRMAQQMQEFMSAFGGSGGAAGAPSGLPSLGGAAGASGGGGGILGNLFGRGNRS
jgi:hypothetical protein